MRIAYNIRKYSEFDLPSRYTFSQKMFKNNAINNNFIFGQLKAHEMMLAKELLLPLRKLFNCRQNFSNLTRNTS